MILRRNRAREEAHTPRRTAHGTEACEGCDKTEQTQNTLFSNDSKRQEVRIRRGGIRFYIRHTYLDNNRVIGSKV